MSRQRAAAAFPLTSCWLLTTRKGVLGKDFWRRARQPKERPQQPSRLYTGGQCGQCAQLQLESQLSCSVSLTAAEIQHLGRGPKCWGSRGRFLGSSFGAHSLARRRDRSSVDGRRAYAVARITKSHTRRALSGMCQSRMLGKIHLVWCISVCGRCGYSRDPTIQEGATSARMRAQTGSCKHVNTVAKGRTGEKEAPTEKTTPKSKALEK